MLCHTGVESQFFVADGRTLGGEIRIPGKTSRPLPDKHLTVIGESLWLMMLEQPWLKDVKMISGSWIHLVQFRRAIMGCVENLCSIICSDCQPHERWLLLGDDLLRLISLSPLVASHWCHDVDELVTSSDASETGGGVCASVGLSQLGLERLAEAESLRARSPADSLLLVDAFSGISAARRARQLLGVSPGSHVSFEVDEVAQSVVKMHFRVSASWGTSLR